MADLIVILASVATVSLMSLIGILFVGLKEASIEHIIMVLIGFASGSLIWAAFFDLLPESLENAGQGMWQYVVFGIVFFFVMEKFFYWRHCHDEKCTVHPFAYLNLIGDGMHNFVDGAVIARQLSDFILPRNHYCCRRLHIHCRNGSHARASQNVYSRGFYYHKRAMT